MDWEFTDRNINSSQCTSRNRKFIFNTYPRPQRLTDVQGILRSVNEIPLAFRPIFNNFKYFNPIQSQVFDDVYYSNKPIILSAPTGSGKTIVFELAIIRLLMLLDDTKIKENFKIIYVAPIKALCNERYLDWNQKFNPLGINCIEITGDSDIPDFNYLISANIVITTPEKWDSCTRKWKDNIDIVQSIKLFMIDEVHLLNEDIRGPTLEAIVSRMKTIQFTLKENQGRVFNIRFVAVSATIPNIEDLAVWIGDKNNVKCYKISEELRPVKLQRHVLGYNLNGTSFKFDMHLNYKLPGVIKYYSEGKPTLIFCSSRKSVEMASKVLLDNFTIPLTATHKNALINLSKCIQDVKLQNIVNKAMAYHHAGLCYKDRLEIENAFKKSLILVLICTNTLAMGVNLPAHLVIIKSTAMFRFGATTEYSESSILQMIGRAGRPQYDITGVAVIMTQSKYVKKYENLINGCTAIESHLHKNLAEHLNSEIVLQTITNLQVAMKWIRSTFLYVRAVKCPINYGLSPGMTRDKVENKLEDMCRIQINALERYGLISRVQNSDVSFRSTQFGQLMTRYYVSFETMKMFKKVQGNESYLEIFNTIIRSYEFFDFTIRVNDKKFLNELNNKPIRFPIKGRIKTNTNKVSCIIQAVFENITIQDPSLRNESIRMIGIGERVSKCLLEFIQLSEKELNSKIFKALTHACMICKCFKTKLWENTEFVAKQLKNIGPVASTALVNANKTTIQSLLDTHPRMLEMILNKPPPFGNEIHDVISTYPVYSLLMEKIDIKTAQIKIKQINEKYKYIGKNATVIIGDSENNLLLFNNKVDDIITKFGLFERVFKIIKPQTDVINAHIIHESIVGVDKKFTLKINLLVDFDVTKTPKIHRKTAVARSIFKPRNICQKLTANLEQNSTENLLDNDSDFLASIEEVSDETNKNVQRKVTEFFTQRKRVDVGQEINNAKKLCLSTPKENQNKFKKFAFVPPTKLLRKDPEVSFNNLNKSYTNLSQAELNIDSPINSSSKSFNSEPYTVNDIESPGLKDQTHSEEIIDLTANYNKSNTNSEVFTSLNKSCLSLETISQNSPLDLRKKNILEKEQNILTKNQDITDENDISEENNVQWSSQSLTMSSGECLSLHGYGEKANDVETQILVGLDLASSKNNNECYTQSKTSSEINNSPLASNYTRPVQTMEDFSIKSLINKYFDEDLSVLDITLRDTNNEKDIQVKNLNQNNIFSEPANITPIVRDTPVKSLNTNQNREQINVSNKTKHCEQGGDSLVFLELQEKDDNNDIETGTTKTVQNEDVIKTLDIRNEKQPHQYFCSNNIQKKEVLRKTQDKKIVQANNKYRLLIPTSIQTHKNYCEINKLADEPVKDLFSREVESNQERKNYKTIVSNTPNEKRSTEKLMNYGLNTNRQVNKVIPYQRRMGLTNMTLTSKDLIISENEFDKENESTQKSICKNFFQEKFNLSNNKNNILIDCNNEALKPDKNNKKENSDGNDIIVLNTNLQGTVLKNKTNQETSSGIIIESEANTSISRNEQRLKMDQFDNRSQVTNASHPEKGIFPQPIKLLDTMKQLNLIQNSHKNLNKVLESFCDNYKLSKTLSDISHNLDISTLNLDISKDSENEDSDKTKDFLLENDTDKKFKYSEVIQMPGKISYPGIVRIPDEKISSDFVNETKENIQHNKKNTSKFVKNSIDKFFDEITKTASKSNNFLIGNDFNTFPKTKEENKYRLCIPRRQKVFSVNRSTTDEQSLDIKSKKFLECMELEHDHDLNFNEEFLKNLLSDKKPETEASTTKNFDTDDFLDDKTFDDVFFNETDDETTDFSDIFSQHMKSDSLFS